MPPNDDGIPFIATLCLVVPPDVSNVIVIMPPRSISLRSTRRCAEKALLEQIFPETRFNSWTVGEVHILDRRIIPNGRRDDFEANAHYANLVNQLSPIGRDVARRCRTSSGRRSKIREFELARTEVNDRLAVIQQGALSIGAQAAEMGRAGRAISRMKKVVDSDAVGEPLSHEMLAAIAVLESELERVSDGAIVDPLDIVQADKREVYRDVFSLIYQCSSNRAAAKSLVDKIIQQLAA